MAITDRGAMFSLGLEEHQHKAANASCPFTKQKAGDHLDNDCDGRYDEESSPTSDDDHDGKIGEDQCNDVKVEGQWGVWSDWKQCDLINCVKQRVRYCDDPKPGYLGKDCDENKRVDVFNETMNECDGPICPVDCPAQTYSTHCKPCDGRCLGCTPFTGQCLKCPIGFLINGTTCAGCPKGQFGGNCVYKCHDHCKSPKCDAVTGDCDKPAFGLSKDILGSLDSKGIILFLAVLFALLLGFALRKRNVKTGMLEGEEEEEEEEETQTSPESSTGAPTLHSPTAVLATPLPVLTTEITEV